MSRQKIIASTAASLMYFETVKYGNINVFDVTLTDN